MTRIRNFISGPAAAFALFAAVPASAGASELRVEAATVTRTSAGVPRVHTRVAWKNAWRNAKNHDAVWLAVKMRTSKGGRWRHARISAAASNATNPSIECAPTADQIGVFCATKQPWRGDVAFSVQFDVDATQWSERDRAAAQVEASVIGLEMVYVPAGPFFIGDPDPASVAQAAFYRSNAQGQHAGLFRVADEKAVQVANTEGALFYQSPTQYTGDQRGPIPSAFPKGTRAMYAMKYEVSQGSYATFLNMIAEDATHFRANNAGLGYEQNRGTIRKVEGTFMADSPHRPANWISWDDGMAFADWAGLRPMTEFEFTKIARGPVEPVAGDYPWGSASKARLARVLGSDLDLVRTGAADESQLSDSTREALGASYWWVMDLAGSVWERVVTAGHSEGRAFRGTHGDGELRSYGIATNIDWPSGDNDGGGYGYRGGGHYEWQREAGRDPQARELNPHSPVSWRPYGSWGGAPRSVAYGFRAVRTADPSDTLSGSPDLQQNDRDGVRRAALDYLEGFYEGDTAKLVRSIRPAVYKLGFGRQRNSATYGAGEEMPWSQFLSYARSVKASGRPTPATAPKEVELLDVLDQTAAVKVTAWWGIDYLLLAKFDGKWMITSVLWQSPPRPGS